MTCHAKRSFTPFCMFQGNVLKGNISNNPVAHELLYLSQPHIAHLMIGIPPRATQIFHESLLVE